MVNISIDYICATCHLQDSVGEWIPDIWSKNIEDIDQMVADVNGGVYAGELGDLIVTELRGE